MNSTSNRQSVWLGARAGLALSVLMLCLLLLATEAIAVPVDGLYQHDVAVADQSEAERRRAYREALERVLVKVSGLTAALQHPTLRSALNNAANLVEEVGYRTEIVATDTDGVPGSSQQGFLRVRFADDAINRLLQDAGFAVWDRNRPSVLVWITVQHPDGRRELLGSGSDHALLQQIRDFSRQRAVPLMVPILDLTDRQALPLEQAWGLDSEALQRASARYQVDSILAGRIMLTPGGDVAGFWQFLFRDTVEDFDHLAAALDGYLQLPLDHATVRLASHFALPEHELDTRYRVTLRVDGVRDVKAYADLLGYIRDVALVHNSRVSHLAGDRVELLVETAGGAARLSEFISLDRDLEPVNFLLGDVGNQDLLHYRWTRR